MWRTATNIMLVGMLALCLLMPIWFAPAMPQALLPRDQQVVVFWHFWGGAERAVVDRIVERFNQSQSEYCVSAVAMPGNNLDLKLFLAVVGGDPPDLVNLDDPVLADWAERGAIRPLAEFVPTEQLAELEGWLFPAAGQLTRYREQAFGLCNGLDVRALYYNLTALQRLQLSPPDTLAELDHIAAEFRRQRDPTTTPTPLHPTLGFLPNPRNLWAWGVVFGGRFYDQNSGRVTLDAAPIGEALRWMAQYGQQDGPLAISLRARDQSLPGKTFPLLTGRYACVVDGQWRVRDIDRFQAQRKAADPPLEFGVRSLPAPHGAAEDAGWINGNYFVVPARADQPAGAWEFMKFWSGFGGHAAQAAQHCVEGGWIPVSRQVVDQPAFQDYLNRHPLFAEFVRLAASRQQIARPNVPGAPRFDREVRQLAEQVMYGPDGADVDELIRAAQRRLQQHLESHGGRAL